MKYEIANASEFLMKMIRAKKHGLTEEQLLQLRSSIQRVLNLRYRDHWFPESPFKGSGYRCIRINGNLDPAIIQAANEIGISKSYLTALFPRELTMWVDPREVAYRIGESGSIYVYWRDPRQFKGQPSKFNYVQGPTNSSDSSSYMSFVPGITRGDMACNYSQYNRPIQFNKPVAFNYLR
ncbi:unnamed protein product [Bemisia tabaci]|uniref:Anti-proliferative protein domain-containing protein n=1 Tax=Bemisia tabaci TaxID=7038 RepID=A0A9P0EXX7_BEMTA|nr:PREDICTED: protein BTG2-like [Bemisia tabaci]XP_018899331.1 PREDICTED: protein BTG2-like [Bemisia tabaci]CAH0383801.1 unnamed protein product [Bemisia tabaci]